MCLLNWFVESERKIRGIGWTEIPAFEFGFDVVQQYQEEACERRLRSIRGVLSSILNSLQRYYSRTLWHSDDSSLLEL